MISGLSPAESDAITAQMLEALTDRRLCYTHTLEAGDVFLEESKRDPLPPMR